MSENIKSIYKVGDKVTIRKTYHPGFQFNDYPGVFTKHMLNTYGGKTFTIKSVEHSGFWLKSYIKTRGYLEPFWYVLEEGENLNWSASMFEESNHLVKGRKAENKEIKLTDKIYEIQEELRFYDGYAVVKRRKDNRYNWIDKDKNLLSPDWFLWCEDFIEGCARVKRGEDYCFNWIDTTGKLLSTDWMQYCSHFSEGFASFKRVGSDDEINCGNWIDKKGNVLSKNWYHYCTNFNNGVAKVAKLGNDNSWWNREVNFVNKNGDLLSPIWFRDECSLFHEGYARVKRIDGMLNWLKEDGKFISREWFRDCCSFNGGFAAVQRENGNWNWVDKSGKILSKDKDFYYCEDFSGGFAKIIHKNGKSSWIGRDGKVYKEKEKENFIKTGTVINTSEELVSEKSEINLGASKKSNEVKLCLLENDNFSISVNVKKKRTKSVKLNFK